MELMHIYVTRSARDCKGWFHLDSAAFCTVLILTELQAVILMINIYFKLITDFLATTEYKLILDFALLRHSVVHFDNHEVVSHEF